jgi:hypothetical protein
MIAMPVAGVATTSSGTRGSVVFAQTASKTGRATVNKTPYETFPMIDEPDFAIT